MEHLTGFVCVDNIRVNIILDSAMLCISSKDIAKVLNAKTINSLLALTEEYERVPFIVDGKRDIYVTLSGFCTICALSRSKRAKALKDCIIVEYEVLALKRLVGIINSVVRESNIGMADVLAPTKDIVRKKLKELLSWDIPVEKTFNAQDICISVLTEDQTLLNMLANIDKWWSIQDIIKVCNLKLAASQIDSLEKQLVEESRIKNMVVKRLRTDRGYVNGYDIEVFNRLNNDIYEVLKHAR